MAKMTPEARVGIFVFIGIVLLVIMSMWLGGLRLGSGEGYVISVRFPNASGLDKNASVAIAGVEVGRVKEILLKGNMAKLVLQIDKGVKVGQDFTALLKTSGLLGEKYVELVPGSPNAPTLSDGGELSRVGAFTDMDRLLTVLEDVANDVKDVTGALKGIVTGKDGESTLKTILVNIESLTSGLNHIIVANDDRFSSITKNLDELTTELNLQSPDILRSIREVSKNLNTVIVDNRGDLKDSIEHLRDASIKLEEAMEKLSVVTTEVSPRIVSTMTSIDSVARKIDRGEGTLGKLINDDKTHTNLNKTLEGINKFMNKANSLRLFVSYRGEYLFDAEDAKSYLSLKFQPRDDKFYIVEVIDDPRGSRAVEEIVTTEGGVTTTKKIVTTSDKFLFSAQFAKKMRGVVLRGGFIESTGGFGIDYGLLNDRITLSFDAFDFDKERNPHLKVGASIILGKYFLLTAGYDDVISKIGLESAYVGLGLQFEDDDLKYLLGSAPPISF